MTYILHDYGDDDVNRRVIKGQRRTPLRDVCIVCNYHHASFSQTDEHDGSPSARWRDCATSGTRARRDQALEENSGRRSRFFVNSLRKSTAKSGMNEEVTQCNAALQTCGIPLRVRSQRRISLRNPSNWNHSLPLAKEERTRRRVYVYIHVYVYEKKNPGENARERSAREASKTEKGRSRSSF